MSIIQKYKTYKDLKNYLDEHYEHVELLTECPKIDICHNENGHCWHNGLCIDYKLKTDGLDVYGARNTSNFILPMDSVQFKVKIDNTNGVLPNTPKNIITHDSSNFARRVFNLLVDAYRRKLIAERAKFYQK